MGCLVSGSSMAKNQIQQRAISDSLAEERHTHDDDDHVQIEKTDCVLKLHGHFVERKNHCDLFLKKVCQ